MTPLRSTTQPSLPMAELKQAQETCKQLLLAKEAIEKKLQTAPLGIPSIENTSRNSGPVPQSENNNTDTNTSNLRPISVCLLLQIRDRMKEGHSDMKENAKTLEKQIVAQKAIIQELEKVLLLHTMSIVSEIDAMGSRRMPC